MLNKKALSAAVQAAAGGATYVEDVFSTYLYDGNGTSQTITNGIDLSGEGGLVWIKGRTGAGYNNTLMDTVRSGTLFSDTTQSASVYPSEIDSYTSTGFVLSSSASYDITNGFGYVSWTFRKAAKFFDVVTYSGTGTAKTVNHNLGSVPGCIIVKRTDSADEWAVYHRSRGASAFSFLNSDGAENTGSTPWNDTSPTSTQFTVGTATYTNANGGTYVAYLFAHDENAFGENEDQDIIKCGSYTGNGVNPGQTITLDWEPQWFLVKNVTNTGNWQIYDNVRGLTMASNNDWVLNPNLSNAESGSSRLIILPTGIQLNTTSTELNTNGDTYIYIAIRRGPMKTPTDATKVFTPTVYTGTNVDNRLINTTIAPDFVMIRQRNDSVIPGMYTGARITGNQFLITGSTNAEAGDADSFDAQIVSGTEYGNAFSSMSGVWVGNDATRKFNANTSSDNHIIEAFKRAPGFFDVVCYTGTGSNTTVSHNLGVAPELLIINQRSSAGAGKNTYAAPLGNTKYLQLNSSAAEATFNLWQDTTPTSSVFSLSTNTNVNGSGITYMALLFASCPGVSKVGSFSHTDGTDTTVNCGFTNGVRYVLIKRTDGVSSWFVYDSARGIVAGNDPYLALNDTAAEVTNNDGIDSISSGFTVVGAAGWATGSYIFLAIA